jgi:hypothetical protein
VEHDRTRLIAANAARGCAVRLRDDKVARRVLGALEERLAPDVPQGAMLVFTLGAPIRTPTLLVDTLTTRFRAALAYGVHASDATTIVHENRVRYRVVARGCAPLAIVGFVLTDDPDLDGLVAALRRA